MINNSFKDALIRGIYKRIDESKWNLVQCGFIPRKFNLVDFAVLMTAYIPSYDTDGNEVTLAPCNDGALVSVETGEVLGNWLQDGVGDLQVCVATNKVIFNNIYCHLLGLHNIYVI